MTTTETNRSGFPPGAAGDLPMPQWSGDFPAADMPPSIQVDGGRALIRWLQVKQEEQPVWQDPFGNLHNFLHDEVTRVMSDHATFSSDITRLQPGSQFANGSLMLTDPPQHRILRGLVIQAFTRRMSAAMLPRIGQLTDSLLDEITEDRFDLIETFAHPLPVMIIGELLGVPVHDRQLFRTWADRLISLHVKDPANTDIPQVVGSAMAEMGHYLADHVKHRRQRPQDDLLTKLVEAEVEGHRLSDQEVVNSACLLLLAGQITSTMALGSAIVLFNEEPQAMAEVRADHGLLPGAFEEVLRRMPPLTQAARIATGPTEVGGLPVTENQLVINWLLAANYDRRQFADPERFDIRRTPNKQYAFGHGIHFCLGAPLAKAEAEVALGLLLDRFGSITVDRDAELSYYEDPMYGLKKLPVIVSRN